MSEIPIIAPPGFTQEEFEQLLEEHIAQAMFDALCSYLKQTADIMDQCGMECMRSDDLRRIALELAINGYRGYDGEEDE